MTVMMIFVLPELLYCHFYARSCLSLKIFHNFSLRLCYSKISILIETAESDLVVIISRTISIHKKRARGSLWKYCQQCDRILLLKTGRAWHFCDRKSYVLLREIVTFWKDVYMNKVDGCAINNDGITFCFTACSVVDSGDTEFTEHSTERCDYPWFADRHVILRSSSC